MQGVKAPGMVAVAEKRWGGLLAALILAALAAVSYRVWESFPGFEHDGQVAGHQVLAIAITWSLGGLVLALVARTVDHQWLRWAVRLVLLAAMGWVAQTGLLGNARWALPAWRFATYLALFGSVMTAEWLLRERDPEQVTGILTSVALVLGFLTIPFEVARWLETPFTLAHGQWLTPAELARQETVRFLLRWAGWLAYCGGLLWAGFRFNSRTITRVAAALLAVTLADTAITLLK